MGEKAADGDSKVQEGDGPGCGRWIMMLCCFAFAVGLVGYVAISSTTGVLQPLAKLLPQDPTPKTAAFLCITTMGSIVLLLPIWPALCMVSGLVFGTVRGAAINYCAIMPAALISFLIGRCLLREHVREVVDRGDIPMARRLVLILEDEDDSLKLLTLFRFLIVPMFVRNYVAAVLEIPFWQLVFSSVPHSVWISGCLASIGAAFQDSAQLLREGKELEWGSVRWQQVASFSLGVSVTVFLSWYAHREYARRASEEDARELA